MLTSSSEKLSLAASFHQFMLSLKVSVAQFIVRRLYGKDMHITAQTPSPLAGAVVFWYMENGARHYVFVKESKSPYLRFPSCLGVGKFSTMSCALAHVVSDLMGNAFVRSLNKDTFAAENISSVPVFSYKENQVKASYPVHTLLWAVQITPEQAQLCQPKAKNVYVVATPEMGLASVNISSSHVTIVKEAQKVIRKQQRHLPEVDLSSDVLEDILSQTTPSNRTIH